MNINMIDASEKSNAFMDKTKYSNPSSDSARIAESMAGYSLDITGKVMENAAYGKEDLKSVEEVSSEAGLVDVSLQRNYMAVMSNSMSEEDFSDLLKEGYNPTHTEIEESVTSLDKLKAKMAESGQIIEGFNDDLSSEDIKEALNLGLAIMPLNDENMAYMVKNDIEPTIENLYKAEYSSTPLTYSSYGITINKPDIAWDDIKPQVEKIVREAGFEVSQEILDDAKWLIENDIPLDGAKLKEFEEIKKLSLPADEKMLLSSINVAMEEGKSPKEANLLETESLYYKAVSIKNNFDNLSDGGDITKRRQLEEVRLAMTVEANLTLLRKGITIDTSDLETLVDELKKAEEEFYKPFFEKSSISDDDSNSEMSLRNMIDIFKETSEFIDRAGNIPIQAVGDVINNHSEFNFENLEIAGNRIASEYVKAEKSYETLMTAPRADMGDSITKAFRNVDEILNDLDLPLSEENRRAVRIMGYSEIQITREAIAEIRTAANTVSSVIDLMTPAKTLQMIREGHNPLTENLYELEAELKKNSPEETTEKYSEFLLKLERRGEISDEERSAFIGMYRLFDKIERRDMRVIGKVLSAGEELNLKNLLSAYRSGKIRHLDINVDDEFGALEDLILKGESITEQIEKGFKELRKESTPESYIKDKISDIKDAAMVEASSDILEELDIPVNVENILAASDFYKRGRIPFKKIISGENEGTDEDNAKDSIKDAAREFVDDISEGEGPKAYTKFVEKSLKVSEEMMQKSETYVDVKEWARLNKQIVIAGNMAKADEYQVPIETEEGYISVHLKIKDTEKGQGQVEASFVDEKYGEIRASFSVSENQVSGIVSARYEGGFQMIKGKEAEFKRALEKQGFVTGNITYVKSNSQQETEITKGNTTNRNLFRVAGIFLKAMEKEQ